MVMDRHGKLILAGLPALDLRAPYSGAWCCGTVGHGKNREHRDFGTSWLGMSALSEFRGGEQAKISFWEC